MTAFAFAFATLAALTIVGVLSPLWRGARTSFVVSAVLLATLAVGSYLALGTPAALDAAERSARAEDVPRTPEEIAAAIERLDEEVRANPRNVQGWLLLGRARKAQERFGEARDAFAQAHRLEPEQPDIMVEYAEAITLAADTRRIEGEALDLIRGALALQPGHQRALLFLGVHYVQAGEPARAIQAWESLLPRVEPATAAALQQQIEMARRLLAEQQGAEGAAAAEDGADAPLVRVRVEIDPALQARVQPGDVLFVFARQPDGPPMPVAASRRDATALPLELGLGDADSPMPTLTLSQLDRVELVARISRSGEANASAGDLEAAPVAVDLPADAPVVLRIDRVRE
ncbi:tetratricopeptide repeat protein [Coralloluteibacterium thermophilus]|uniref:Tetratricopeptide repeat protein n=1 Tax=Coralloluteibacterium thermophilum TaxID=2707049 RepID=A0ABV9NSQ8_9GAMM